MFLLPLAPNYPFLGFSGDKADPGSKIVSRRGGQALNSNASAVGLRNHFKSRKQSSNSKEQSFWS
ncbi:hypothetical protein COCNU_14G008200 [Cocos nucifera]|uniref:Uncharacterized protein n=1 Tax=Cocos nucifera TaxID=13894 RepID=A0A8K0NCL7_COCNU|nr:hypothetical protein COCNU_14G008200 [Cocos nucifera]